MRSEGGWLLLVFVVVASCSTVTTPSSSSTPVRVADEDAGLGEARVQVMRSVAAGGPGLVAVGSEGSGADADAAVWTSVDGSAWSRVPDNDAVLAGGGFQVMASVAAGGPGLVAVGSEGSGADADAAVWTSVDGSAWSRVLDDAGLGGVGVQVMRSVAAGGPGLVAVGSEGSGADADAAVWTSVDGLAWSRVPDDAGLGGGGFQVMASVTAGGPGLVAVGSEGSGDDAHAAVWTSVDGLAWSRVPDDDAVFARAGFQVMASVTAGGPGLVAVGVDGLGDNADAAVWTSADGISWSRAPYGAPQVSRAGFKQMDSVTEGGPGLVAVGWDLSGLDKDAAVWTSADGITWSQIPHDDAVLGGAGTQEMLSVTAAGPGLVAVGVDGSGDDADAAVWTSADGATWSQVPPAAL